MGVERTTGACAGSQKRRGGSVGLTDHTTPDLNGTVAPLHFTAREAGKEEKSLFGGEGGKAPAPIRHPSPPRCAWKEKQKNAPGSTKAR